MNLLLVLQWPCYCSCYIASLYSGNQLASYRSCDRPNPYKRQIKAVWELVPAEAGPVR